MISEVAHRAGYDLSQWQSIATLLSDARKKLALDEYTTFYNAVTAYSRSRGTDVEALSKIESVLAGWATASEVVAPEEVVAHELEEDVADEILAEAMKEAKPELEQVVPPEVPVIQEEKPIGITLTHIPEMEAEPQKILTIDEAKARILAIKNEIHERIGNPVALIGDMGSLGKEYMAALLRATRSTMGGAGGAIMPAMRELEAAYEKLRTSATTETNPDDVLPLAKEFALEVAQKAKEDVREVTKEPLPEVQDTPLRVELEQTKDIPESKPKQEQGEVRVGKEFPESQPVSEVTEKEMEVSEPILQNTVTHELEREIKPEIETAPILMDNAAIETVASKKPTVPLHQFGESTKVVLQKADDDLEVLRGKLSLLEAQLQEKDMPEESHSAVPPEHVPVENRIEIPEIKTFEEKRDTPQKELSLQAKKVVVRESLKEKIPEIQRVAVFGRQSEKENLYQSDAVTDGLRSLLMSWEIFRGGFLSGKERGIAHPLYIAMKEVPMSDVLAGKFEGAKTSTVISANDYVNAWRFEQGVEYNPVETFEHYLRRVIYRILTRAGEI